MSSFFYTQVSDNGRGYRYQGVKRFLKKAKVTTSKLGVYVFESTAVVSSVIVFRSDG